MEHKPALYALIKLHAELGGRIKQNATQAAMLRVPVSIEHSYRYASVNGGEALPAIVTNTANFRGPVNAPDSLKGAAAQQWRDSVIRQNRASRTALRPDDLEPDLSAC